ncbi:MAG: hypothetical protein A2359_01440 [Candidatus Moranbacteria bacterium RIFOXYB1_FULL_43_19]|nr:MAG: hypothetical protein A2359_01440 [Candidatus Moranbacteria bacterium RIFOXYB1_FULL_43_19]OGI27871.1 MAG: hypothetical protein A2184_02935 [Candidatus Moranbacteria bacterium RIFOXYA1_FULL_44_7]OGI33515.1 MAG: hypothetical protein A2420_00075 [Candidatus Moranbacteria bacterium RIFOXYC1_FULL_44_13]OGI38389.1 MAG: hypothetical protein A2612_02660 [Candidatus Moranbacteria bacterium RIFOXYD1_FULL_44_12]
MKKKIQSIGRKIWAVAFLFPLVALAQWTKPGSTNLPTGSVFNIIKNVMNWLLGILGFVAVIGFVISGIMFLISAGDEDRQKTAKKAMYYSITGVIVGLVGYVVLVAVEAMLQGSSTTF